MERIKISYKVFLLYRYLICIETDFVINLAFAVILHVHIFIVGSHPEQHNVVFKAPLRQRYNGKMSKWRRHDGGFCPSWHQKVWFGHTPNLLLYDETFNKSISIFYRSYDLLYLFTVFFEELDTAHWFFKQLILNAIQSLCIQGSSDRAKFRVK